MESKKYYIGKDGNKKELDLDYILQKYAIITVEELDSLLSELLQKGALLADIKTLIFINATKEK